MERHSENRGRLSRSSPCLLISSSFRSQLSSVRIAGSLELLEGFLMLRAGQKLGKYRLLTKLSVGTFATVFRAFDTLEGVYVALKIPHPNLMNKECSTTSRRK